MNILRKKMAIALKKLIVFCSLATSFLKNVSSVGQIDSHNQSLWSWPYREIKGSEPPVINSLIIRKNQIMRQIN